MNSHTAVFRDTAEVDEGLVDQRRRLLEHLRASGYHFITPTPATHRRVLKRPGKQLARTLRDVLGWSLPFRRELISDEVFDVLQAAKALERVGELWRATLRVSSLGPDLLLHSAFPPTAQDAVFFGPDTYRFANFLRQELENAGPFGTLIDIGTGAGAGALAAARAAHFRRVIATDINPQALDLARANSAAAGVGTDFRLGCGLESVSEQADVIVANPPFIAGGGERTYRDGGDMHGARLSLDWALAAAPQLTRGGRFLLYTGSAIVEGEDQLRRALEARLDASVFDLTYRELDPDIFGGQLGAAGYEDVERIAAVGAVVTRR